MKRWSLKAKLTLFYTAFMLLLTCAALGILFSMSGREVLASVKNQLESSVQKSVEEIEIEEGRIEIDNDFYSAEKGIYLSLYDESGYFLYGKVPYGTENTYAFEDGNMREIKANKQKWYLYDVLYRLENGQNVYVRGMTSINDAEESFRITIRFAVILLPIFTLAAAFLGYQFTRRALLPVRKITNTVRQICSDADLSKRVGLTEEQKESKDEIYHLAQTFDEMLGELETVFQREKQFTSDVSHELRTPVSVMLAQCDACLSEEALTDRQREQMELIAKKAREMAGLISSLLLLSRADEGRQKLNKERLNLSELTQIIAEEQQMLAEEKQITVSTEIAPDIYAEVDESFYIRMVVNLISNAVFYGKEGGSVKVSLQKKEENVVGTVEDNGIGISAHDMKHIWERFYRADTSRTDGSHSGLGLSMVKWIAEAHGGGVSVESREGEGSRFLFYIPF